ncbi:MAG: GNAT family N-acetyltransferase [Chloroflexota bacterium]|nr:GNAT family N-acetyltransferase [Chloroflexota bacterium]
MYIRRADRADLRECMALDHSYTTSHAWRFEEQEQDGTLSFVLRPVRLPHRAHVSYPKPLEHLRADWRVSPCFLVAHERGEIWGYIDLRLQEWQRAGWIEHLGVDPKRRRQGIGTALLARAERWAVAHNLRRLMADVSTNNHAAICFLQTHRFVFCGFHDRYYANQDIALFFSKDLS